MFVTQPDETFRVGNRIYIFCDDGFEERGVIVQITDDVVIADFFDWLHEWPLADVFWFDDGCRRVLTADSAGRRIKTYIP